jgi:hypothetical protein
MTRWREQDWLDGHYELLMDFDDPYAWIDAAKALWVQPQLSGVWTTREFDPDTDPRLDASDVAVTCELMTRHLRGVAHLPTGPEEVAAHTTPAQYHEPMLQRQAAFPSPG